MNPPLPAFARDDNNQIITFENRAAAEQYVSDCYSEPSLYDGADTLKIVEAN